MVQIFKLYGNDSTVVSVYRLCGALRVVPDNIRPVSAKPVRRISFCFSGAPEQRNSLSSSQHDAQEFPNLKLCVPAFFAQESGALPLLYLHFFSRLLIPPKACLTCRKRKLVWHRYFFPTRNTHPPQRCDAARPHCATCVKYVLWAPSPMRPI